MVAGRADGGRPRWAWATAIVAIVAAEALLVFNMIAWHGGTQLSELRWPRRYWEDSGAAVEHYLDRRFPRVSPRSPATGDGPHDEATRNRGWQSTRDLVTEKADQAGIRPSEFWRTIPDRPLLRARNQFGAIRPHEDQGRALAVTAGFELLGGVAPYLLLWLGVLACLPVLAWTAWEFFGAGYPATAVALLLSCATSPFVVGCLSLPHSGMAFYLLAVLGLMGLAAYGILGDNIALGGLFARALGVGVLLALCALMRSDCALLLPGFVLALGLSFRRIRLSSSRLALVGILVVFLAPYLLLNPPRPRPVWVSIWEGLGDFDTTRGHVWRDAEAARVLREAGFAPGPDALFGWLDAAGEAFFRESVRRDIRADPAWYARIVRDRLFSTVTQEKLWPSSRETGRTMALSSHPNQGDMDKYYRLTPTVDCLGVDGWRVELPILLMAGPTALLVLLGGAALWSSRLRPARPSLARSLIALSCPAVGALGAPVLISTASALETQAFALIYALGLGLLLDTALRLARPRLHFSAGGVTRVVTMTMTTIAE